MKTFLCLLPAHEITTDCFDTGVIVWNPNTQQERQEDLCKSEASFVYSERQANQVLR